MALVWIKEITNKSTNPVTFQQNDPSYHPVIHSGDKIQLPDTPGAPTGKFFNKNIQVNKDQRIVVNPGGSLTADYFVIPWEGYGRLRLGCNACGYKTLDAFVGGGGLTQDSIKFNKPGFKPIPCGDKGPMLHAEVAVRITNDQVLFDITNANSIPALKELQDLLIKIIIESAKKIAEELFKS